MSSAPLLRRQWQNFKAIDGDFGHFCCQWTFFKAIDGTMGRGSRLTAPVWERIVIDDTCGERVPGGAAEVKGAFPEGALPLIPEPLTAAGGQALRRQHDLRRTKRFGIELESA